MLILMCLISCLFGFANVHPYDHMQKQVDNVQFIEKKTKDNYVQTASGYYRYGLSDLFSTEFLVGLINYYVVDLEVTDMLPSSQNEVNNYVIRTNNVYDILIYNESSNLYYNAFKVSNIVMNKSIRTGSVLNTAEYNFIFSNGSPYDQQISINFYAQEDPNMRSLIIYGCNLTLPQGNIDTYYNNVFAFSANVEAVMVGMRVDEKIEGFNSFIGNIYNTIRSDEYNIAYTQGYNDAYGIGYAGGYNVGHNEGYYEGEVYGYQQGYTNGINDTQVIGEGTQASIIFGGILDVAFIPVNVFLLMFQYEVFGINIAGLVSGLISIALIIILIRVITGKKLW